MIQVITHRLWPLRCICCTLTPLAMRNILLYFRGFALDAYPFCITAILIVKLSSKQYNYKTFMEEVLWV